MSTDLETREPATPEQRDPTAATVTQQFLGVGQPMIAEWDAETAIRMGYMANIWVYRCIQVTATTIAGFPFRVGADPSKPGSYDLKHPLAKLLGPPPGGPAPGVTPRRLWAFLIASYLATGRFGCEIEEPPGSARDVVALWPLIASQLTPVPSQGGSSWWENFKYGPGGKAKTLRPDQVWYDWRPSQTDYRQPESCLIAARLPVSTAVMLDRYAYSFLVNDARPASVIVHEAFASKDEREAWRSQFLASHRGPLNAGKPIFAEVDTDGQGNVAGGFHIETLGLSQKDADLVLQLQEMKKAICAAFGTPMSKLANSSESTFSNAEQDDINWHRDLVKPLCEELADSVNIHLAPRFGSGSNVGWFDFSRVPQLTSSKLLALGRALPAMVGVTVRADEVRAEVDLPPLPNGAGQYCTGGNPSLVPPSQTEVMATETAKETAKATADAHAAALATAPAAAPAPAVPAEPAPAPAKAGRAAPLERRGSDDPEETAEDREAARREYRRGEWRRVDAHVRTMERLFAQQMRQLFADQKRSVLGKLGNNRRRIAAVEKREHRVSINPGNLFDAEAWSARTTETVGSILDAVLTTAGSRVAAQFAHAAHQAGVDSHAKVTPDAPLAKDFVQARANRLGDEVTDTTYGQIKDAISAGIDAGEGIDDIGARISAVFDDAGAARAELIARTETIGAYNGATELYGRVLGEDVVGGQEWIATSDDRTRPDHADADGQRVAVGEPFSVGGEDLMYPGDENGSEENVCNCRCTQGLLTPDEMDDSARLAWAARKLERRALRAQALLLAIETTRRERATA